MMSDHEKEEVLREQTGQQTVNCKVCLKEIPASAAQSSECEDYVAHFCGTECYDKWEHPQKEANQSGNEAK